MYVTQCSYHFCKKISHYHSNYSLTINPFTRISQKTGKSTRIQTVRTSLKSIGPIKILFIYYYSPINSDANGRIGDQLR